MEEKSLSMGDIMQVVIAAVIELFKVLKQHLANAVPTAACRALAVAIR